MLFYFIVLTFLEEIVPIYSEAVFFEHFRLTRQTANLIAERFGMSQYFNNQIGQYGNISALHKVGKYKFCIGSLFII